MRKNNKGISMISLVVVIISIIILSALAIGAGYRYMQESERAEKATLTSIISEAAYKRQNDYNVDAKSYYEGSVILDESDINENNFRNLPKDFDAEKEKINQKLNGTSPVWFVLDGESAKGLGVEKIDKYEKYIVKDLNSIPKEDEKYSPVALVEYITGTTYLVEMKGSFDLEPPADHEHIWATATCTENSKCRICGQELPNTALGHDIIPQTCTQAEMCRRCGEIFKPAKGHDFNYGEESPWKYNALKHWIECKNGCGTQKEVANHSKNYIALSETDTNYHKYHIENCYICGWESVLTEHNIKIVNIDATHHKRYCTLCNYEVIHEDDGWHSDNDNHWKECDDCDPDNKILDDKHVDEDGDHVCDVCGKDLDTTPPKAFDAGDIRIVSRTTHQIQVSAQTEDNDGGLGMSRYEFSIDGGTTWQRVSVSSDSESGIYKFENQIHNKDYEILVRGYDKADNYVEGSITSKTYEVPAQFVNHELSQESITRDNVRVTLTMPTLSLPQEAINELLIVYRIQGNGTDWKEYTTPIEITEEGTTIIYAKIVDKRSPEPNSSSVVKTITVSNIDRTPPTVTIEATDTEVTKSKHTAVVRIKDALAGIAKDTIIYYAWKEGDGEPTSYTEYKVTSVAGNDVTVQVTTPSDVVGKYYLWIKEGVKDAVGNETTAPVKSSMYFDVDDRAPHLLTRTMRNKAADAIDELYAKTGSTITVEIEADKELAQGPLVTINSNGATKTARATSTDKINWTATITLDTSFAEELLDDVKFSDYTSSTGKVGEEYTTTTDNKYVTYDKTLPALEYINK